MIAGPVETHFEMCDARNAYRHWAPIRGEWQRIARLSDDHRAVWNERFAEYADDKYSSFRPF